MESETEDSGGLLVPVHHCWGDTEAVVLVSFLAARGIEACMNSQIAHSVYPLTVDGLGGVQILVEQRLADEARRLLAACPEAIPPNAE